MSGGSGFPMRSLKGAKAPVAMLVTMVVVCSSCTTPAVSPVEFRLSELQIGGQSAVRFVVPDSSADFPKTFARYEDWPLRTESGDTLVRVKDVLAYDHFQVDSVGRYSIVTFVDFDSVDVALRYGDTDLRTRSVDGIAHLFRPGDTEKLLSARGSTKLLLLDPLFCSTVELRFRRSVVSTLTTWYRCLPSLE